MKKIYKSRSSICINVLLKSKKSLHVAFTPQSDGSSVFLTDNEEVQHALEHHYQFGTLFKLDSVNEGDGTNGANGANGAHEADEANGADEDKSDEGMRTVKVSDLGAAKDYLADTFGLSRTSLRTEKSILEAAKSKGIEFEGF